MQLIKVLIRFLIKFYPTILFECKNNKNNYYNKIREDFCVIFPYLSSYFVRLAPVFFSSSLAIASKICSISPLPSIGRYFSSFL